MILPILKHPDARLRIKSDPVEKFDDDLQFLINDMFETMYHESGIGLSAIQVNVPIQLIVIDLSNNKSGQIVLINPKITKSFGSLTTREGCLSILGITSCVTRSRIIHVEAVDRFGQPIKLVASSLLSTCIQHEMDHLDGKLLVG